MMFLSRKSATASLAALMLLVASQDARAGANLVQNGGFEQNGGVGELAGGITTLADWTVGATVVTANTPSSSTPPFDFILNANADTTGFPSVYSPPNIYVWGPATGSANGFTGSPNGGDFFGSDGGYATAPISQSIGGLTVGAQYTLSFEWAASQFTNYYTQTTQDWQVTFGSQTVTTTPTTIPGEGFSGWMTVSYTFTASTATQTLSFLAQGTPVNEPPFTLLDGVSLTMNTASVPEPTSLLMLGVGTLGVIGIGLRRRARAVKM
jgi:hypothetical protein